MTTILCLSMMVPISFANAGDLVREEAVRKGKWEILFSPQYTLAKNLGFDGGTTAKVNDTWGFGLQIGYNLNEHINLVGYFSWTKPDYQAVMHPAPGNSGPARNISGSLQMNTFGGVLTYNVLATPVTPYVEGSLAGTYINTDRSPSLWV